MEKKYSELSKNVVVFAISSFGTNFISFLLVPLYTDILSTREYGIVDNLIVVGNLAIPIFTFSISNSILRFSINSEDKKGILSYGIRILLTGSAIFISLLSILYFFCLNFFPWQYFVFIFFYFFLTALYQLLINYFKACDKIIKVAIAGVIFTLGIISCNIVFLLIVKIGIVGYALSMIVGVLLADIYLLLVADFSLWKLMRKCCDTITSKKMIKYSAPLILNNLAVWINGFIDRLFLTQMYGASENGIYSIANKIPSILVVCFTVFSQAWNLSAIKEYENEKMNRFYSQIYNVYNFVVVVGCSVLVFLNIPLTRIIAQKEFFIAWKYSSILLISAMFNGFTLFLSSLFIAAKKTNIIAISTCLAAFVNVIFNMILIPYYGSIGAAIATVISFWVMWLLRIIYISKLFSLEINLVKDVISYILIVVQVIIEHFENNMYMGQFICIGLILLINIERIKMLYCFVFKRNVDYDNISKV